MIGMKRKMPVQRALNKRVMENYQLYLFLLPVLAYLFVFSYLPMLGIVIAFENYKPYTGIFGSQWVGFKHFERFFQMQKFGVVLKNTLTLSLYQLLAGFPLPIILALLLNACPHLRLKRAVQTITYAPHFISVVVIVGMLRVFLSPTNGMVGSMLRQLGLLDGPLMVLVKPNAFPHLYVWSGVWQNIGWGSIIYLGALTGVDPALHESAVIDGASKFKRIWHIDIPCIAPTIVVLLVLDCGKIMNVGFEKVFLMQNALNLPASETIATYVYKIGFEQSQYSFSTAINVFNSVINFVLLMVVNSASRVMGERALW